MHSSLELVQNILFIYPGHEEELTARSWAPAATTLLIIWFARILEASDLSELHQLLGSAHVDLLGLQSRSLPKNVANVSC